MKALPDRMEAYDDPPRTLLEHLTDLRACVLRVLGAWCVATLIVLPFAPYLLNALLLPLAQAGHDPDDLIRGQQLGVGVHLLFQIMLWGGLLLSLPLVLFFAAQFVFPGLTRRERRRVSVALSTSGLLFLGGVVLAYKTTLALAIEALFRINTWMGITIWPLQLDDYVAMIVKTLLAFGLAFQLPIVLLALGYLGILSPQALRAKRRHAIVAIFVLAAVLTPPDPISQLAMALPMCLLYEICILLIALRRKGSTRSDGAGDCLKPQPPGTGT